LVARNLKDPDLFRGYSRLYSFFSSLYLHGLSPNNLDRIRATPELAVHLVEPVDWDNAGADYQDLFGFNVFAYESAFLDPSGLLGGAIAGRLIEKYREYGYQTNSTEGPDHLGQELGFLAYLAEVCAKVMASSGTEKDNHTQEGTKEFIDQHIFHWLPPFILAVRNQGNPLYSALADLTLEALSEFRSLYGEEPSSAPSTFPLIEAPVRTDNSIADITAFLLSPVSSGIYLTRKDIAAIARKNSLPRGFGQRRQMLRNLLQSAITYDRLPQLTVTLGRITSNWLAEYEEMASDIGSERLTFWLGKVHTTRHLLAHLEDAMVRSDHSL
jgi:TorA maturation chaperone TorD